MGRESCKLNSHTQIVTLKMATRGSGRPPPRPRSRNSPPVGQQGMGERMHQGGGNRSGMSRPGSASPQPQGGEGGKRGGRPPPLHKREICIDEEVKIAVRIAVEKFRYNESQKEYEFPSSLTSVERAFIHRYCQSLGIKTKSRGKGSNRYLTIFKKDSRGIGLGTATFSLCRSARHHTHTLLQRFPITGRERQELMPRTERGIGEGHSRDGNRATGLNGRLNNGIQQVPPPRTQSDYDNFRRTLPVAVLQEVIVKTVNENQVVLVAGETGSGKTTQVPQFILDDAQRSNRPCRIICTQPRRISALTVAERVASERGEKIGQTVGYQIRLESRVSPRTLLTFCTNGVLLRTLMGGDSALTTITHVIVDEIHERDRFSDFLLIKLREMLGYFKGLKVVLMSATLNTELFQQYFGSCPIINVSGNLFDVTEFFLEDVLRSTNYSNQKMQKYKKERGQLEQQQSSLDQWYQQGGTPAPGVVSPKEQLTQHLAEKDLDTAQQEDYEERDVSEMEPWLIQEMDKCIMTAWLNNDEDAYVQLFHLIMSENVSVDYRHSETCSTTLMIAAGRGNVAAVEQLLALGANINLRAPNGLTALDWARKFGQTDTVEVLEAYIASSEITVSDDTLLVSESSQLSTEDRELLKAYHQSFDDEHVDLDLILCLLFNICSSQEDGAILVFLPGYEEIVTLRDAIMWDDKRFSDTSRYQVYTLHSAMQSGDQKRVFQQPPAGVRKIILSTNIAETSVTINDVVFVIDSGKVKEKSFDALTSVSMLKSVWVSKASAQQRKGRAGRCRPGVCFHLFSRVRYESLQEYQDPELLRTPLQELCLQTKLLSAPNTPISEFLAKAPEPPAFLVLRNAVQLLKTVDALDMWEDLTELGHHMVDLPIEPRLAKMVLYSVVLKCLDPVLTIACALAYRDPFILPNQPSQKRAAVYCRKKFSAGANSDHMALLRAFQGWQKAKSDGWERSFCEKNFLCQATMEMIFGMRTQLLGQLRASGFVRARGGGDIRDLNTNSENWAVIKAALCAGSYPNMVRVDRENLWLTTQMEKSVRFHNTSVLGQAANPKVTVALSHAQSVTKLPTDWLVYEEISRAHRYAYVRCCTLMSPVTVAIFAGPSRLPLDALTDPNAPDNRPGGDDQFENYSDSGGEEGENNKRATTKLDDWISFKLDSEAAHLLLQLRLKWHSLFLRRMRAPAKPWSQVDEGVIRAVIGVLSSEEQALGLQQPSGIGQRPRPMFNWDFSSSATESYGSQRGSRKNSTESNDSVPVGEENKGDRFYPRTSPANREKRILKRDHRSPREFDNRSDRSSVKSASANSSQASSRTSSCTTSPCPSPNHTRGGERTPPSSASSSRSGGRSTPPQRVRTPPFVSPKGGRTPQQSPTVRSDKSFSPGAGVSDPNRYFILKCNNQRNLDIAMSQSIWATTPSNEKKLNKAFKDCQNVYLVFSVQGSGHFQGYARMVSSISKDKVPEFSSASLGGAFRIEWIKRMSIPFQAAHHLLNPWNENKKVQISRDGQEIEPQVGEQLLKAWDRPVTILNRSPGSSRPSSRPSSGPPSKTSSPQGSPKGQRSQEQRFAGGQRPKDSGGNSNKLPVPPVHWQAEASAESSVEGGETETPSTAEEAPNLVLAIPQSSTSSSSSSSPQEEASLPSPSQAVVEPAQQDPPAPAVVEPSEGAPGVGYNIPPAGGEAALPRGSSPPLAVTPPPSFDPTLPMGSATPTMPDPSLPQD
ncbi:YTHDC2 [Branchiostoma lanceolatum]|uniref:YTHDC2 protein n=1 Tax=Branchiostoma lanceolatum TaxID=7740 RepID=A0A8J9ZIL3_BRALA|nr:YTHDC2 [Branchiostoma lanceolatum]